MRSIEDKGCYNLGPAQDFSSSNAISFEFRKGNYGTTSNRGSSHHHRSTTALGKPSTPSKWDDAQKWIVGFSRGSSRDKSQSKTKPRNSNADDTRLIAPVVQQEQKYYSNYSTTEDDDEAKEMDSDHDESIWRINKSAEKSVVRSICVRDMGTDMTPIASQEPSRTATPIRATSPISSGSSTPVLSCQHGIIPSAEARGNIGVYGDNNNSDQARKHNTLQTRAMAWDEAERAKYTARYKREEVKIQAWENHEKRKAEMEMKKMEVKAERLRTRAEERCANKLAATSRIAEEKRANAESKLNEKAMRTSERADYIRRTGHLPSSFSFKLPSLCW